jgi:hypothetical protein
MPRLFAAALFAIVSAPALAAGAALFPVSVPTECVALAEREHEPVVISNKVEALREKVKLARMSDSDPLVSQCKQAVARLQAALQDAGRPSNGPVVAR